MNLKEKNSLSKNIGLKDFKELKTSLSADSQLSQLVSADDVINSIKFIFSIFEKNKKERLKHE